MTGRAGLRGGLIGGAVAIILAFMGLVPCLGCVTMPLIFLAFGVAGWLAAARLPKPRTAGDGAAAGAVAGAISGLMGGAASMGVSVLWYYNAGGTEAVVQSLPTDLLRQLSESGIDPYVLFGPNVFVLSSGICCGIIFLAAVGIGALAGAIVGAARGEPRPPVEGEIGNA